jgi:ribosomal protein S18 acetylase RimI-like enzyme
MKQEWKLRLANDSDIAAFETLITLSVRGLQSSYYSAAQMDAALGSVFGVDRQLIRDRTYFVVETGGASSRQTVGDERRRAHSAPEAPSRRPPSIVGCGGWSKRKTLFGSDHQTNRDDAELDPTRDSARIRAFFVHPDWARRGIGRAILEECEKAIRAAKFESIELAATLPGVPFYAAFGYVSGERSEVPLANGLSLSIVRMTKKLA